MHRFRSLVCTAAPAVLAVPVALAACGVAVAACGGAQKDSDTPAGPAPLPPPPPPATATATDPADVSSEDGCPPDMAEVPEGMLFLGSPDGAGRADERPQQQKQVKRYCLDLTEVTVADYRSCVDNEVCDELPDTVEVAEPLTDAERKTLNAQCTAALAAADDAGENAGDLPLSCVSYEQAILYCRWKGRRLPTEAELEYAAKSGEDRLEHPWGDTPPNANVVCWQQKDGPCRTRSKPPQAFGIYDLIGNVAEWTSTPYGPYGGAPLDPDVLAVRGASWKATEAEQARSTRRGKRPRKTRNVDLGFRCAKDF